MAAHFELFKDERGEVRFHLMAANGEVVVSSEGYSSKAAAEKGIEAIKKDAAGAAVVDKTGIDVDAGERHEQNPYSSRQSNPGLP